ncbi:MAG: hypothetical protein JO194_06525 [Candidatus Eremiobacteraeota bacterium]|nr:hypothetical protein [Candidatus Eremiobacteraeota bacterium]
MNRATPNLVGLRLSAAAFVALVSISIGLRNVGAAADTAPSLDLLAKAADPNPGLSSYIAAANLAATLHAVLPVHKSFSGTAYYLKPKRKVIFNNVSGPLSKFKELATMTPSFEELTQTYTINPLEDNGTTSTYSLIPKKSGARVSEIDVTVDDASALATRIMWKYVNGGSLRADQTYTTVNGFHVIEKENIAARYPDYSADGTLSFSNYQLNAAVDPAIFASK